MGATPTLDKTAAVVSVTSIPALDKNFSLSNPVDVDKIKDNEAETDGLCKRIKTGDADRMDRWRVLARKKRGRCRLSVVKWSGFLVDERKNGRVDLDLILVRKLGNDNGWKLQDRSTFDRSSRTNSRRCRLLKVDAVIADHVNVL
jgi:hypothetical protein